MDTICYASWKGGTGKTLLSFNTLERASASGMKALGCDFDPQRMLSRQAAVRERNGQGKTTIEVVEGDLTVQGVESLLAVQAGNEYDLIVCDLPGTDTFVMDRALSAMDAILIPVNGAPYELLNTARLVNKTHEKGWNAYLVLNNVLPFQKRKEAVLDTVAHMDIPVSPTPIVRRVAHWDAAMEGLAVAEFAPSSAAAAEIREYWAWLQGEVGISRKAPAPARELAYA